MLLVNFLYFVYLKKTPPIIFLFFFPLSYVRIFFSSHLLCGSYTDLWPKSPSESEFLRTFSWLELWTDFYSRWFFKSDAILIWLENDSLLIYFGMETSSFFLSFISRFTELLWTCGILCINSIVYREEGIKATLGMTSFLSTVFLSLSFCGIWWEFYVPGFSKLFDYLFLVSNQVAIHLKFVYSSVLKWLRSSSFYLLKTTSRWGLVPMHLTSVTVLSTTLLILFYKSLFYLSIYSCWFQVFFMFQTHLKSMFKCQSWLYSQMLSSSVTPWLLSSLNSSSFWRVGSYAQCT